ncbi:tRNA (guanosine(46)-N7)-methyltransferase TrmB [Taibaiella lutea]|uniref:tRNA (guanine(46)-N(7))-methyltransferase n=1 Tax=Taibaiella lutea TaxID=2608001 RepID=A0A5M6CIE2_9BACT|nr:tRNA (guanosine(46)-N7)-methyltransferase TrmB [Taibaiella lutea]KAA5534786.1 tRNA (guanosine(46)-N7)-methyltransferase TrmB [Taibaiella lutea]
MGQKKLIRFEAIKGFDNVLEYPKDMQGNWKNHFGNDNPVTLELACGKGEYSVGLGRLYPDRNFIGIDLKGNRIWRGAKTAIDDGLTNVAFLRSHIDKITDYFAPGEVHEIWITFPDPQLRASRMKKRLTYPRFLRLYQQITTPDATINLKTDSPDLYNFTKAVIDLYELEILVDDDNIYAKGDASAELSIKTHYEGLDIAGSNRIHYLKFKLNKELPKEKEAILKEMFIGNDEVMEDDDDDN